MQDQNLPIATVFNNWKDFSGILPDVPIAGSPERTLNRWVVQDRLGDRYLLEQIPAENLELKRCIINVLDFLHDQHCPYIQPYCKTVNNETLVNEKGTWWQLIPFMQGVELDRGNYFNDGWRGKSLANFLVQLRTATTNIDSVCNHTGFSITWFINDLLKKLEQHSPQVFKHLLELSNALKEFENIFDGLEIGFCHGDVHPLNVIWGHDDIISVIDWEFHGPRARIFDAANLVGCLAMEDPRALTAETVKSMLLVLHDNEYFNDVEWRVFLEYIIATRFLWLSDWLRRKDEKMINLELSLMYLLFDNRKMIRQHWNFAKPS